MYNNYLLCHYGVKGMKWGVIRTAQQLGRRPRNKKQAVKNMTDDELNRKINRLQREQQYKNLTASTASKVGKRIVQGILITAAVEVAKNYVAGHMKDGITAAEEAIKNLMSE